MSKVTSLNDFPECTISFLKKLSKNNNRDWFEVHRDDYNKNFFEPAQEFVVNMGAKLFELSPFITAVPKIDKSIFRIHRDVRFSKDKSPYKTNLGVYFWEGGKKMESSGFYFHIDPKEFFIGAGIYMFPPDMLKKYRDLIANSPAGDELSKILKSILRNKKYSLGGKKFKKIPKGFNPDSKQADLLLHESVYTFYSSNNLEEIKNKNLVNFVYKVFKDMSPLHFWMVKNLSVKSI